MSRKLTWKIGIAVAVIAAITAGILLFKSGEKKRVDRKLNLTGYVADTKLEDALTRLSESEEKAEIINKIDTSERVIALTLDGMLSRLQMEKIIEILEENEVQATFFVEGKLAAEEDEVLDTIKTKGFGLGNYTLYGEKHMEELTQSEQVEDFVKSKNIFDTLVKGDNELLKCNVTVYTDTLRQSAKASQLDNVVESTQLLSSKSFTSYEAAHTYISKLKSGSVLSIKLSEELSKEEFNVDETPAKDLKPSLQNKIQEKREEVDIIEMVEFIAVALKETGTKTVLAKDLPSYHEQDYDKKYKDLENQAGNELADVYTNIPVAQNWVGLSLRGVKNDEMLDQVLEILEENKSHATFFVTGSEVNNHKDKIDKIIKKGHTIENGGYTGASMVDKDFAEVYLEILRCKKLIKDTFGINSELYMPANGKYDDTMRKAAKILDCSIVTYNKNPITDKEMTIEEIIDYFEKGLKKGDVLYLNLEFYEEMKKVLNEIILLAQESNLKVVGTTIMFRNKLNVSYPSGGFGGSKHPNVKSKPEVIEQIKVPPKNSEYDEAALTARFQDMREKNEGKQAKIINNINIVNDAVVFTFYDISDEGVLNDVISILKARNAHGSFFVGEEDVKKYPDRITKLHSEGHEIGIAVFPKSDQTFESVCLQIYKTEKELEKLGINTNLIFQPWSEPDNIVKEAVSAFGKSLAGYDISIAKEHHIDATDATTVVSQLFPETIKALQQGQILYFRLNYYNNKPLHGNIMEEIIKQKLDCITYRPSAKHLATGGNKYTGFTIKSLSGLLSNQGDLYQYPLNKGSILSSVKGKIYPGQLNEDLMIEIHKRYIGNVDISTKKELVGFDDEEIEIIDKTGYIKTEDNVIFLTFDDWGSDAAINKLLYVLNKHNVTAVFFVKTNYVVINPNLLRKIALAGHTIASHTDEHIPLPNIGQNDLRKDLVKSYTCMENIIGDVKVGKRPSLTTWFRPPTLAVSKDSIQTVFDNGFSYFVCGTYSTHDYEALNAQTLCNNISKKILNGQGKLINGSIIIMHMSDNSSYTAEAIDLLLTQNSKKSGNDPTKFRVGDMSDYLVNNYIQSSESLALYLEFLDVLSLQEETIIDIHEEFVFEDEGFEMIEEEFEFDSNLLEDNEDMDEENLIRSMGIIEEDDEEEKDKPKE